LLKSSRAAHPVGGFGGAITMSVHVRPLGLGRQAKPFMDVMWRVYRDDPAWIPVLRRVQMEQLNPAHNPFLRYGEAQLFLAERDGEPIGRISAQTNPAHNDFHRERGGFFGFFECTDDPEAIQALLDSAESWLRAHDADWMRGPMSFTINQETGTLIDGFDTPPMVGMPHGRPYYDARLQAAGLDPVQDLVAWRYPVGELSQRSIDARERILALGNVTIRQMERKHLRRDIGIAVDIFNDAWHDNWGFVPVREDEIDQLARDLAQFADPRLTSIISIDDEPAAMAIAIPNVNEAARDVNGRLFPFGAIKIKWRLWRGPSSGRVILLGVRRKFRTRAYAGLHLLLFSEVHLRGKRLGFDWAELGWVLQDNALLNSALPRMGATVHKTYRLYQRSLQD
jgi:hypothetical protein